MLRVSTRTKVLLAASVCACLLSPAVGLAAASTVNSATGPGHNPVASELRTFSFAVQKDRDVHTRGQGELHNRAADTEIHLEINRLSVSEGLQSCVRSLNRACSFDSWWLHSPRR